MPEEIQKYAADPAMFEAAPMRVNPAVGAGVHLLWATEDPLGAMAAMGRMYKGIPTYSLDDIEDDERRDMWKQMHNTHLRAPLESIKFHFFIEGVDRAFTHQLVRQRTAVYAQESLRFAVKEDLVRDSTVPPSIIQAGSASQEARAWEACLHSIEQTYMFLIDQGVPAEDARGLLPQCVATRVHYITDLRNLIEHAGNRLCTQAQFAWRDVFRQIVKSIQTYNGFKAREYGVRAERYNEIGGVDRQLSDDAYGRATNWQFELIAKDDWFKPVCFALGHCPFTATFDRQCTIRPRVQTGDFDKIQDWEWLLDPESGRHDEPRQANA
jgi:flavin-dependent thymidylate synthase